MNNNCLSSIPRVLAQISKVLSESSNQSILLLSTGERCINENGKYSISIKEIEIPRNLISVPNPKFQNDKENYYKVNRVRLGSVILYDTYKGFPFSEEALMNLVKAHSVWAYYEPTE